MRPPYLATGGNVLSTMKSLGYRVITDDIDSGDWNGLSAQQSEAKFTQAGAGGLGHIPLMHEVYASTVNTLVPWLITWAKQNKLKLVTVGESSHHFSERNTDCIDQLNASEMLEELMPIRPLLPQTLAELSGHHHCISSHYCSFTPFTHQIVTDLSSLREKLSEHDQISNTYGSKIISRAPFLSTFNLNDLNSTITLLVLEMAAKSPIKPSSS